METMHVPDVEGQKRIPSSSSHQTPVLWPWMLVIVAWTVALVAALTNQNSLIDHHYLLEESHLPVLVALVVFQAGWQVMTVGMMLPSSMPMVYMIVHAGRQQRRAQAVPAAFLAGYALAWTAFALVAFLGDTLIHWLVHHWFWLDTHSWVIGATTFAAAGVFQFSPLKGRCLKQCRSPFSFFVRSYRKGVGAAWHLGLRHGAFCLGSCWALMLVMFGLGVGSLVWMAMLAGVIVVEKTFPGGQRLRPVIGIILLGLSALWLSGGNTHVHVAAAPQIVLFYKFVCFACVAAHAKHTNLYYNLWSPQATRLYEDITPTVEGVHASLLAYQPGEFTVRKSV
jgi:predicted metal-binding membrane protein